MQPLFEHRLELAGYRARALELEGDGPPLLFLHGYADSADTWRLVLDRLARAERRAVALDMPGFGACDRLDDAEPILPQLDRFADAALEEFAAEGGALVCGNSLGGCVAMRLAERSDLGGVVGVAPAGLDMARWFTVVERDPVLRSLLAAPVPIPGPVLRRVVAEVYRRLVFHRPADVSPQIAATFASHFKDRVTTGRMMSTARRLIGELRDPYDLGAVSCPVILVWGARDGMVFQTGADRVVASVPESTLVTIKDCGHCPQIEAPERLTELLLDFPASLMRAGGLEAG